MPFGFGCRNSNPAEHGLPGRIRAAAPLIRSNLAGLIEDLHGVQGPLRSLLVLEIGEDIASILNVLTDPVDHCAPLFGSVRGLAITVVAKIGCDDVGRDSVFGFGYA